MLKYLGVAIGSVAVSHLLLVSHAAGALALYSTGMASPFGSPSVTLADTVIDPHYKLISAPSPVAGPNMYVTRDDNFPIPPWTVNNSSSKWIQPVSGTTDNHPDGLYKINTTFDLTGYDLATVSLKFFVASDNNVDVFLNDTFTGIAQVGFTTLGGPYTISSGFNAGLNTLQFQLTNWVQPTGNPTGLRVQFTSVDAEVDPLFAPAVPEPASLVVWSMLAGCVAGLVWSRKRAGKIAAN